MLYEPRAPLQGAKVIEPERVNFASLGLCYEMAVEYGCCNGHALLMDYFYPKENNGRMPAIIWVHGGGWFSRDLTRVYRPEKTMAALAQQGFFCASIDYRLSDEAVFPAQIQDCKCAVRYLRAHAAELGIDPEHIAAWGESAGAHLVLLMACTDGVEEFEGDGGWSNQSSAIQAAISWYAPCDLEALHRFYGRKQSVITRLLGCDADDPAFPAKAEAASPSHYAARACAPVLVMHGDRDSIVPYIQSEDFCKKARAAGNAVQLITVHEQGHGFFDGDEYEAAMIDFFFERLMNKRRSIFGGGRVVWEKPVDWDAMGVTYIPDVTYATIDGIDLKLDWMIPRTRGTSPLPVVVWFHGGGWSSEELNRKYRPEGMLADLCRAGFACVSADYRLLQQAPYPAPIQDAHCVIRYIRAHAEEYHLDPEHIGVWGESAGAGTAILLGVGDYLPHHRGNGPYQDYSSSVQAVCSWYGFGNYVKQAQLAGREHNHFLNVDYDIDGPGAQKMYAESAIAYASRPLPPFLFIHGSADPLVPSWQSVDLYHELVSYGNQAELYIAPGQVHGFFTDPLTPVKVREFFVKHLHPHS